MVMAVPSLVSGGSATELSATGACLIAAAGDWRNLRQFVADVCIELLNRTDRTIPVVLDLVNPVRSRRRLVGGRREQGSMNPAGADQVRELNEDMA
jgi:hypothetical protein